MITLKLVTDAPDISTGIQTFNREAPMNTKRATKLARETLYWVFNPRGQQFGPGKFVGYQDMDFRKYEEALNGNFTGSSFHGHSSKAAIEKSLGVSFEPDHLLSHRLKAWAGRLFGPGAMDGVTESKWRFVTVTQKNSARRPRAQTAHSKSDATYWFTMQYPDGPHDALCVDPDQAASAEPVKQGDWVAIYETSKHKGESGESAVIALANVARRLTSPEVDTDEDGHRWLRIAPLTIIARDGMCPLRNLVRILKPDVKDRKRLNYGSYIHGYGGRVVQIEKEQFERIGDFFADYESENAKTDKGAVNTFETASEYQDQSFAAEVLRTAIESHAMKVAEAYLTNNGFRQIRNCSTSKPYDFSCIRDGRRYCVEVKGTRSEGMSVILTANEVKHADLVKDGAILFLVHSVDVTRGDNGQPIVSGGKTRVLNPWRISKMSLKPLAYRYELPTDGKPQD